MRRLTGACLLAAVLVTALAVDPARVAADGGESSGLLGGLAETVEGAGDVVSETVETTGLDALADVDVESNEEGSLDTSFTLVEGADAPLLNADASVGAGGDSLAEVEADAAVAGELIEASADLSAAGEDGLATVAADASVAGGEVLDAAVEAAVAGEDGLVEASVDASAAGGLVDVEADASVLDGTSLVGVDLEAGVGGEGVGVDLDVPVPDPSPVAAEPPPPAPASAPDHAVTQSSAPLPGAIALPPEADAAARPASRSEPASAQAGAIPAGVTSAPAALVDTAEAADGHIGRAGRDRGREHLPTVPAAAPAAGVSFVTAPSYREATVAALAAAAAAAVSLLALLGRRDRFRPPELWVCLPPAPPG